MNKHGPDKLYQVTSNISGSKDLDLTLQRGQIVALLHGMDTKGNTNRWLVDAGGTCEDYRILLLPPDTKGPSGRLEKQEGELCSDKVNGPVCPVSHSGFVCVCACSRTIFLNQPELPEFG